LLLFSAIARRFCGKQKLTQVLLAPDESIDHKVGEDHRGDAKYGQDKHEKFSLRGPMVQADMLKQVI
jgi:hypothetical protein